MGIGSLFKYGAKLIPGAGRGAASKVASGAAKGIGAGALGYGIFQGAKLLGGALGGAGKGPPGSQSASNDNKALTSKFGMVGAAGRQTSGGGTMPDFSRMSSVSVSSNDSQKEILQTAVKLLASIDASMKTQIQQQRFVQQQQALQQRESNQEDRSLDAVIAEKVDSFRSSKVGSTLEGIFNLALIGALGFAASKMNEADATAREFMSGISDTFKTLGLAAIALGGGYAAIKGAYAAGPAMRAAFASAAAVAGSKVTEEATKTGKRRFRDPTTGKFVSSEAGQTAQAAEKGLARSAKMTGLAKLGLGALASIGKKVIKGGLLGVALEGIAYTFGGKAITGRNIAGSLGAIIGSGLGLIGGLGFLSIPVALAGGYAGEKIATSVYDFFSGNSSTKNNSPDATQINPDVEKILSTIRMRESGGNYGLPGPIGMPGSASGAYGFTRGTWQDKTKLYGIGTQYSRAHLAPPEIQDAVAAKYVEEILRKSNGDVSMVPIKWYTGNYAGNMSAEALAANNGLTAQEYQKRWMQNYNDPSTITKGGGQYGAQAMSSDVAMGMAQFQAMAAKIMSGPLAPTNMMTHKIKRTPPMSAENIQSQAVAMEASLRSKARAEDQKKPPALTRDMIAKNVAATSAGGAMNVPNPGYEGQNNMLDYLVYFGLAA